MWKWFFWGLFSGGGILWWHVNFDGLKQSCVSRATAAAAKLGLSDNNIWLLGVDRAEVSSLKIWWNGSRRGNREFKGFHHLRLLSGSPTKPVPHSKDYKPTVGSTLPIHFYLLPIWLRIEPKRRTIPTVKWIQNVTWLCENRDVSLIQYAEKRLKKQNLLLYSIQLWRKLWHSNSSGNFFFNHSRAIKSGLSPLFIIAEVAVGGLLQFRLGLFFMWPLQGAAAPVVSKASGWKRLLHVNSHLNWQ